MSFQPTPTLMPTLDAMRTFLRESIFPLERQAGHAFYQLEPELNRLRQQVKEAGWWLPQISREAGGMGLSLVELAHVGEVLGHSPYGHYVFNCQAPDAGNMEILLEHGSPAQKERFLHPLLAGAIRSCFSMTEPEHAGSNPLQLGTTAVKDGDSYLINGHKWFTSSADGAAFAIVMAITNPEADTPYRRASQLLVPMDTPGVEFVRNIPVMGDVGEGWMSHAELRYHEVRIPRSFLLGEEGAGFAMAQERLGPGRIHHCMRWIGMCERAFELMCRYAVQRSLKPGQTIAHQQSIQHWIAESRADIHAARLMVLDAAEKIDAVGAYKARVEVSVIKFFCANVLQKVLDRALQVHGALGMTDDLVLASWYRHERAARIYDGADEVHKNRVARAILKDYGLRL